MTLWACPKVDGITLKLRNGSPTMPGETQTEVNNFMVGQMLGNLPNFDGFFTLMEGGGAAQAREALLSSDVLPEFRFWVYDLQTTAAMMLRDRLTMAAKWANGTVSGNTVRFLGGMVCTDLRATVQYERDCIVSGHTGIIVRDLSSQYAEPWVYETPTAPLSSTPMGVG